MAVILVDASVIIDHLRKRDRTLALHFQTLTVGICGVTRSEMLAGVRTPKDRVEVLKVVDKFRRQTTRESIWDEAGDHNAILKSKGLNVPFPDLLLATIDIHHDLKSGPGTNTFP